MRGVRYIFAVISSLCLFTNFASRVCLNVAIVAMVNSSALYKHGNNSVSSDSCEFQPNSSGFDNFESVRIRDGEFLWSPSTQGVILGSFYYGYCCFQVVTARLAEIYSAKWVFAIGSFFSSLMTLLIPTAAYYGAATLVFVRVLQGIFQCAILPTMYSLFGCWFPECEYGVLTSAMFSGINLGIIVGMAGTGFLCNSRLFDGWPSAFYLFGGLNCLTLILWCLLVTSSPASHPLISESELKYITSDQKNKINTKAPPIPWCKIMTSIPFLVLVFTQICQEFCFYIILNDLPTFFDTVLHFDIEKNGFLSSFPFLLKAIMSVIVGCTVDYLIRRKLTTINFIRKFCTAFAFSWFSIGLVGVFLAGCNVKLSTVIFMCSYAAFGFMYNGYSINHVDLSPEYAGTLYGIANTFSSLMGFVAPMFVGFITDEHQGIEEWYIIFGTVIGILILAATLFTAFGSTKKQNWINTAHESTSLKETSNNYNTMRSN